MLKQLLSSTKFALPGVPKHPEGYPIDTPKPAPAAGHGAITPPRTIAELSAAGAFTFGPVTPPLIAGWDPACPGYVVLGAGDNDQLASLEAPGNGVTA